MTYYIPVTVSYMHQYLATLMNLVNDINLKRLSY